MSLALQHRRSSQAIPRKLIAGILACLFWQTGLAEPLDLKTGWWRIDSTTQTQVLKRVKDASTAANSPSSSGVAISSTIHSRRQSYTCLTQERIARISDYVRKNCQNAFQLQTPTQRRLRFDCLGVDGNEPTAGEVIINATSPERFSTDVQTHSDLLRVDTQDEAHWISADCKHNSTAAPPAAQDESTP